jgi:hypothetical protein
MQSRLPVLALSLFGALAACGGPAPGSTSYLLLDGKARASGFYFELESWQGSPLFPIRVEAGESVSLASPTGRRWLEPRPGALGYVRGREGEVIWARLDVKVRSDELLLEARADAARQVAETLGADVAPGSRGAWRLIAPELLDRSSFLQPPEGVFEAIPELGESSGLTAPDLMGGSVGFQPGGAEESGGVPNPEEAALVGLYQLGSRVLLIDGAGGFVESPGCGEAPVAGRFGREGDRVLLSPERGLPFELITMPDGALRDAYGESFMPVEEVK